MAKTREVTPPAGATVDEVRVLLSAEAERVMAESKPTPTQAEVDAIVLGEANIDDKVNPDNPDMPPVAAQQEMLDNAEPNPPPTPPDEKPPPGTEPPPLSPPPPPDPPPPEDPAAAAAAEAQRRQAAAADPKAPYNTRTVPRS